MGRPHLKAEERALVLRLRAKGLTFKEIGEQLDCSIQTVSNTVTKQPKRTLSTGGWSPGPGRLTLAEREEISLGLRDGQSLTSIAAGLGRHVSTVSREVAANGGRGDYRAWRAHQRAEQCARRPKPRKLASPRLAGQVTRWLKKWWSPEEIARRLRLEFPDDPMMWVSHETIYKTLFVQGRGELRRELTRCLRSGRAQRRPQGRIGDAGTNPGHGHDLRAPCRGRGPGRARPLGGRPHHRQERQVGRRHPGRALHPLRACSCTSPTGADAERWTRPCERRSRTLPDGAVPDHHLGPGQGDAPPRRLHASTPASRSTSVTPTAPGSAGSNENTNGLLRQYMPKGTDLSVHSARDLAALRSEPQRPSSRDPRIYETIGEARRAPCAHWLKPPGDRALSVWSRCPGSTARLPWRRPQTPMAW